MVKRLRITLIAAVLGLALLALIPAGASLYLNSPHGQRQIRKQVNLILPGSLEWSSLDLSLFRGSIDVDGLLLHGPEGKRLAGAERLYANVSWMGLLRGRIRLQEALIEGPWVEMERDAQGELDLIRAFRKPSPPEASPEPTEHASKTFPDFSIDSLKLSGGSLAFSDLESSISASLEEISIWAEALVISTPEGNIRIEIGRGAIESPLFSVPLDRFTLAANLEAERLSPLELRLDAGDTSLRLDGTAEDLGSAPRIEITLDGTLDLAGIRPLLQLEQELTGLAVLSLSARGLLENPVAEMKIDYGGGLLRGIPFDRIGISLSMADQNLEIQQLSAETPFGALEGEGEIDFSDALSEGLFTPDPDFNAARYRLKVSQKNFSLQDLEGLESRYRGRLESDLTIEGKGFTTETMDLGFRASVKGSNVFAPGMTRPADLKAEARGEFRDMKASVGHLSLAGLEAEVTGKGLYDADSGSMEGEFRLDTSNISPLFALAGIEGVRGAAVLDAWVEGSPALPGVRIEASGTQVEVSDLSLGDILLEAALQDNGDVEISSLTIANQDSRASVRGLFGLLDIQGNRLPSLRNEFPLDLVMDLEHLDPSDFSREGDVSGSFDGRIAAGGLFGSPEIQAELSGRDITLGAETLGDLESRLSLSGGDLEIDSLALTRNNSSLVVEGTVGLLDTGMALLEDPGLDLEIRKGSLSVPDFLEGGNGIISLAGSIQGSLRDPGGSLSIEGRSLAWREFAFGDLDASLDISGGRLSFSQAILRNGNSTLELSGSTAFLAPEGTGLIDDPKIRLRVSGDRLDLAHFSGRLSGIASLEGDLEGSISRPEGFLSLDGEELGFWGQSVNSLEVRLEMDGESIRLERFLAEIVPGESIAGTGTIDLSSENYQLEVTSQDLTLSSVDYLAGNGSVEGDLRLELSGRGSLDDPGVEGRLSASNVLINQKRLDDILLRMSLDKDSLQLWGQPGFDLHARYSLDSREFSASALLVSTQLAPYFRILGLESLTGEVDGNIEASGRIGDPDSITVDAELTDLTISDGDRDLLSASGIRTGLRDGELILPRTGFEVLGEGRLDLEGRGDLEGNIDISLRGTVPAAGISPFWDHEDELDGILRIDMKLEGPAGNPSVSGNLDLEKISFYLPGIAQKLENVSGRLVMDSSLIRTDAIRGNIEGGNFTLSGSVRTAGFRPSMYDLRMTTSSLPLELRGRMSLLMDSTFSLRGPFGRPELDGRIILLNGVYYKDVELSLLEALSDRDRDVSPESFTGRLSYLNNVKLDILVRSRRSIRVENNLAMMNLAPDLRIRGTLGNPVITGRASIEDGVITYRRTRFRIQTGVVDFINPYRTEPTIDIEGETEVRDWLISLNVNGTLDNLDFRLTSDSSASQADLLSLLLLGRTMDEMRISGAGSGRYAGQLIGGLLAGAVGSGLRESTGLDIVELDFGGGSGSQGSEDIELTLGKELSRRLTLKYGAEFKRGDSVQKVTSEYKMLEDLILSLFQDTEGNLGGAITYKLEFR